VSELLLLLRLCCPVFLTSRLIKRLLTSLLIQSPMRQLHAPVRGVPTDRRQQVIKVKLCISSGEHVTDVMIPPFQSMPDIIVWGERFFKMHQVTPDYAEYREGFAYWVPPTIGFGNLPAKTV
jgi:hypothetical protein